MEAKKREREEQHLFLTAKVCLVNLSCRLLFIFLSQVITDDTFAQHEGFDLATFDEKNWPPSDLPSFRVLKQENYSTFKTRVARHFNYPENQIRLWVLVNRQNKTVRPDTPIPENEPALSLFLSFFSSSTSLTFLPLAVEVIRNNMAARQNDLRLYLDVIPDPTKVNHQQDSCGHVVDSSSARNPSSIHHDLPQAL